MIFEKDFLDAHLNLFQLSKIDGIDSKKEILYDWFQRYESGKLNLQNETSIGADFINDIFGEVLGFNYRNPHIWNLEKELKTLVDGKKPDGAFGYFRLNEELNADVHGIIELKNANTDLDSAQKRFNDKRTPIEQAFSYAPKYGQKCKWVVVSNFIEIRLYQANDASNYEIFLLNELQNEQELKRFFFVLQREHLLTKSGNSRLEKLIEKNKREKHSIIINRSPHLLDEIYDLIKKFDGLSFINPNILANAKPFNNLNEYVWHYSKFCLQSSEEGIFNFFNEVKVEPQKITISEQLESELVKKGVVEYRDKLEFIIKRLNECAVFNIECYEDVNKVKNDIKRTMIGGDLRYGMQHYSKQLRKFTIDYREKSNVCNCLQCCYQRLDITTVLKKLKSREGNKDHYTLESAYFHHLFGTNNFKTSYLIYKNISTREEGKNEFLYFIAKYNLISLHNLVDSSYELEDKKEIMNHIKSIDLDMILHELDVIDLEKRNALIEIKDKLIQKKTEKKTEENIGSLIRVRDSFKKSSRGKFPNYSFSLNQHLVTFLSHYSSNYILGDVFTDYKIVCEKLLRGYLISYSINDGYYARLKQFEVYHINLIIFDLFPDTVEKLFNECNVDNIILSKIAKKDLLEKTKNFLQSNHSENNWLRPIENEYLAQAVSNFYFKQIYEHIFYNTLFLLSKIALEEKDCKEFIPTLINFLKVDTVLYHGSLKILSKFIIRYGNYFTPKDLIEILKLAYQKKKLGDEEFIQSICFSLNKFHHDFQLGDQVLTKKAILSNNENGNSLENLVSLWLILDKTNKKIIEKEFFKKLNLKFDPDLYHELLYNKVVNIEFRDYFDKYLKWIDKAKGNGEYKIWNGRPELTNFYFVNFAILIYSIDVDLQDLRIKQLSNLSDWHEWIINIDDFDYSKFQSEWILIFSQEIMLKRFGKVPQIGIRVKEALEKKYDSKLAKIFIKYLS